MAILIKCNGAHVCPGNAQSFTLPVEDGVDRDADLEAFVWVNERSRQRPWGNGLSMRGTVTSWERAGGRSIVAHVQVTDRLPAGFGMDALGDLQSEAARALYRLIKPRRHSKIWGLSAPQRDLLDELFRR